MPVMYEQLPEPVDSLSVFLDVSSSNCLVVKPATWQGKCLAIRGVLALHMNRSAASSDSPNPNLAEVCQYQYISVFMCSNKQAKGNKAINYVWGKFI